MRQSDSIIAVPKRSIKSTPHEWRGIKKRVAERDHFQCQACGRGRPMNMLHFHHIIPKGRIRIDHEDNILTMCFRCHRLLHDGNLISTRQKRTEGMRISVNDIIELYRGRIGRFL